jgi:hypothetical protein
MSGFPLFGKYLESIFDFHGFESSIYSEVQYFPILVNINGFLKNRRLLHFINGEINEAFS